MHDEDGAEPDVGAPWGLLARRIVTASRRRSVADAAMIGIAAVALVGCGAGDGGTPDSTAISAPAGTDAVSRTLEPAVFDNVGVTVFRNRADDLQGVFTVKVDNTDGTGPLAVDSVTLVSGAYATAGPLEVSTTVAAGLRLDIEVPVGDATCGPGADPGTARVDLVLGAAGDPARARVTRQVEATELERWNARDCEVAAVVDVSSPELVGPWTTVSTPTGPASQGLLRLRVPDGAPSGVTLGAVERSVILTPDVRGLPLSLAPGETADVPVLLSPARCDPHGLGEAKYGFVFVLRIAVGDSVPLAVPVAVPETDRGAISDMIVKACGIA